MVNSYKYSLFVVKTSLSRKERKKRGACKYTGIILDTNKRYISITGPESYNKLGFLVYMMNELFMCGVTRVTGFSTESGDYTDSIAELDRVKREYKEYCFFDNSFTGKEEYKKFDISLTINNEGFEHFTTKNGTLICRNSFNTSNIIPKFKNTRDKMLIKAYNMTYKF